jgi:hypothetical protein
VETGEVLDVRQRNLAEEIRPITVSGKWKDRHQDADRAVIPLIWVQQNTQGGKGPDLCEFR